MKEQLQNIKEQALKTIGDCVDVKQLDELSKVPWQEGRAYSYTQEHG